MIELLKRCISAAVVILALLPGCAIAEETSPMQYPQTGLTTPIPSAYLMVCETPGNIVTFTYDSNDYVRDDAAVTKAALVYLPYGYDADDAETRYDVFYLMHGWGGSAYDYFRYEKIVRLLDNMIAQGDIPPMIVVTPTFYNENSSADFSSSIEELRLFHRDFEEHLMPAVETTFHTYALSASREDLMASRDHRLFGGFSLGSVTTWLAFCHDADYIRSFLPMSGSCWYYGTYGDFQTKRNVDHIVKVIEEKDLNERGYSIYFTTGTQDAVKSQSLMQAEEMLSRSDVFPPEHFLFYQKEGGYHDLDAVAEYLYNGLPILIRRST